MRMPPRFLVSYHLDQEIGEQTDVSDKHPEVVAQLQKLADRMKSEIGGARKHPWRRPAVSVDQPSTLYPTEAPKPKTDGSATANVRETKSHSTN